MKIIQNDTKNEVPFSSLSNGTVFMWNNIVFIKCSHTSPPVTSSALNAVNLVNGLTALFVASCLVIPCYNAALHLNEQSQVVEEK
tara:strand:- start:164 stop:418 length:255 start_codon:yes stop_codon:yes gene_type:complete